ncbi:conserved hypothetical protein [Ricinus communis]|uniref:Uncharacterized protein n=1 Tax=Ricinus communis TaxID=3988 RepID=B9TNT9_RICCO|nr:conserved hypothetical protein [Ricinus communis]
MRQPELALPLAGRRHTVPQRFVERRVMAARVEQVLLALHYLVGGKTGQAGEPGADGDEFAPGIRHRYGVAAIVRDQRSQAHVLHLGRKAHQLGLSAIAVLDVGADDPLANPVRTHHRQHRRIQKSSPLLITDIHRRQHHHDGAFDDENHETDLKHDRQPVPLHDALLSEKRAPKALLSILAHRPRLGDESQRAMPLDIGMQGLHHGRIGRLFGLPLNDEIGAGTAGVFALFHKKLQRAHGLDEARRRDIFLEQLAVGGVIAGGYHLDRRLEAGIADAHQRRHLAF